MCGNKKGDLRVMLKIKGLNESPSSLLCFFCFQMVFFLVLSILWFIVCVIQVVIGFLGWVIYSIFHEILKDCTVEDGKCVCKGKSVPIDGKSKLKSPLRGVLPYE